LDRKGQGGDDWHNKNVSPSTRRFRTNKNGKQPRAEEKRKEVGDRKEKRSGQERCRKKKKPKGKKRANGNLEYWRGRPCSIGRQASESREGGSGGRGKKRRNKKMFEGEKKGTGVERPCRDKTFQGRRLGERKGGKLRGNLGRALRLPVQKGREK